MEELMKEEKEGVKAAEQEKPKKRRNRKKNRKNEMRKSYFAGMISMLAIVMIVLVGTTFLWPGSSADHPGGFWSWRKTAAIKAMISQLYAGDVDDTELSDAMYKGMISGLGDKYSTYYTKEEYEAIKTAQEGYYQGIGVTVTLDGDKLQVTGVQDDTPAAKAGIQADDRIVKIDGQTLEGLSLNDAVGLLKNSENDTVTLSIEIGVSPSQVYSSRFPFLSSVYTMSPSGRIWRRVSQTAVTRPPGLPRRSMIRRSMPCSCSDWYAFWNCSEVSPVNSLMAR